jgi:hypothetical protein
MTKAYLMGFIGRIAGKEICNMSNPWYNPFADKGYIPEDKAAFEEYARGWHEADSEAYGMEDVLKLASGK